MTNRQSIVKRIKVSKRNNIRNKMYKTGIKTLIKKSVSVIQNCEELPSKDVNVSIALAYSRIDKAVQRGILHINNGARKKSRLAKALTAKQNSLSTT